MDGVECTGAEDQFGCSGSIGLDCQCGKCYENEILIIKKVEINSRIIFLDSNDLGAKENHILLLEKRELVMELDHIDYVLDNS